MAQFEIVEKENMRFVRIDVRDEVVTAEAGALSHMMGDITMEARIPSVSRALKSLLSAQALIRPKYTGTGTIHLEPSVSGYHIFELTGTPWILERGAYWASDSHVELGVYRERVFTAFWSGEGFIVYHTRVNGHGKVVLRADGPVEQIDLKDGNLTVDGRLVIARTDGLTYRIRRATSSILGSILSGESRLRVYQGTGSVLMARTPYWNKRLLSVIDR
jgi:uncharacterized protein (AIM24 family)